MLLSLTNAVSSVQFFGLLAPLALLSRRGCLPLLAEARYEADFGP
jgi:hypothetical protein